MGGFWGAPEQGARPSDAPAAPPDARKSAAAYDKAAMGATPSALARWIAAGDDLSLLRAMLFIRRFEEKAGQLFAMGEIGGFCHLSVGQEAIAIGLRKAMRAGDSLIAAHRHHGHLLAAGVDPGAAMAELTGRAAGLSRGKGGSIHMFAPELGYYGGHGVAGAPASLGVGLAFAHQFRGDGGATIACFGDAAADQGQVAESFNMAARWRLPIIFAIENNGHGEDLSRRGAGFDLPGQSIDAGDVFAIEAAARAALALARAGAGPSLLDLRISRWRGHFSPRAASARDAAGAETLARDPLDRLRTRLAAVVDADHLRRLEAECRELIGRAAAFALAAPEPVAAELTRDVWAREGQ